MKVSQYQLIKSNTVFGLQQQVQIAIDQGFSAVIGQPFYDGKSFWYQAIGMPY